MALRLFVALDLPAEIKLLVAQVQARIGTTYQHTPVRWANPASVHITLKYLGLTDHADHIKQELDLMGPSIAPFVLHTTHPGAFPHARQPRILWLGVGGDLTTLTQLQQRVEARIAPIGFPTEPRPFTPHITLGRVKANDHQRPAPVQFGVEPYLQSPGWNVHALVLMLSETGAHGAQYTPIHTVSFDGQ